MLILLCVVIVVVLIVIISYFINRRDMNDIIGGSRSAIFSRFNYQPEFPFISKFDKKDLDLFSKEYNMVDNVKFIVGRPYKFYHSKESTWLYPWQFPQEIDDTRIQQAINQCKEPMIMIKTITDKLGGLSVETPKDVVYPSTCFINKLSKKPF